MNIAIKTLKNTLAVTLLLVLFAVDYVAASFSTTITQFVCGSGINTSSQEFQEAMAEGTLLAEEICEEGTTLLVNRENTLPLTDYNINVFGWGGCDNGFINQGTGSGTGSTAGVTTLYKGLRSAGFTLNEELCEAYNALPLRRGNLNADSMDLGIYEASTSFLTNERIAQAKNFSDIALVVLSRRSGEGGDCSKYQTVNGESRQNNGRTYLQLCAEEEDLLDKVSTNFGTVIVIMNTTNLMECGFIETYNVDAALAIYAPGNAGVASLGRVLSGEVDPSGHTVDTWPYDHKSNPTYFTSGLETTKIYTPTSRGTSAYVDYEENIYVGYLWYETAWKEGYFERQGKTYEEVVQFPFGYGLSYTQFSWEVEEATVVHADGSQVPYSVDSKLTGDDAVNFKLFVQNTGKFAGRDVVQLYYSAPYTKGGIEKPYIKLGAFAKTALLRPNEGESLTLTLKAQDMRSYDCYDANNNSFMGYELEAGTYDLSLRTDCHTVKSDDNGIPMEYSFNVEEGVKYHDAVNRFTNYTNPTTGATSTRVEKAVSDVLKPFSIDGSDAGCNITYLSRADFDGTFPKGEKEAREGTDELFKAYGYQYTPPADEADVMPVTGSTATHWKMEDMLGVPYDDPKWDEIVSQLTKDELFDVISNGGYRQISIASINKPACTELDGPAGLSVYIGGKGTSTNYPCETMLASTWNWKLAYRMGRAVANEARAAKVDGWYAPACNLHRSPFDGRNYEYYSEDGYISGVMATYTVIGAQEGGLYPYVKHFAANETDHLRGGKFTWLTEQAFREVYLKPFEMAVRDGKTIGVMSSYNRIGATRASGCYSLCTEVLRNEWGFVGSVVTDAFYDTPQQDADECIRSGNDLLLSNPGRSVFHDTTTATAVKCAHNAVKNLLYTYVETQYHFANATGLDLSSAIGTKTEVFPWWIPILVVINVVIVGALAFWIFMVDLYPIIKKKKKNKKSDSA